MILLHGWHTILVTTFAYRHLNIITFYNLLLIIHNYYGWNVTICIMLLIFHSAMRIETCTYSLNNVDDKQHERIFLINFNFPPANALANGGFT